MSKIGLRVEWTRSDSTYMARQLAYLARDAGLSVEVLPTGKPDHVDTALDRLAMKQSSKSFNSWVHNGFEQIFFFSPPDPAELGEARTARSKISIVCLWSEVNEDNAYLLEKVDRVVCPAKCVATILRDKCHLDNLHLLPWSVDTPVTRDTREVDPRRIGLLWPLEGSQSLHQEPEFIPILETVLARYSNVWLTITYSDGMTPAALKDLRRLVQLGNGRVELFKGPSWEKHHLLFGQHDLVVWPTLFEDVGLIGLGSIYMGTPVLAFDMPLIGEYLKDGVNGVLVPCDLDYRWPGAAQVTPNYRVFGEYLESMLDRPEYLTKLRQSVHTGVQSRRDTFFTRWQKLLVG